MTGKRIWYLTALLGALGFYLAYGEWFSCILLLYIAGLPWLSLLLSLPAIVTFRLDPEAPEHVRQGEDAQAWLLGSSRFPLPPFKGRLLLKSCQTGLTSRYHPEVGIPTDHCGAVTVTVKHPRVCDYLGLFSFPSRPQGGKTVLIRPDPIPLPQPPDLNGIQPKVWKPKPGGGFSENHELRAYRPGDSLNQVHWKLTAKTGIMTIREAMEPQREPPLLTMTFGGTPELLDRKLGQLQWLGDYLLEQGVPFQLRVLTGAGIRSFSVGSQQELKRAVDALLRSPISESGSIRDQGYTAFWLYHIGGQSDEA